MKIIKGYKIDPILKIIESIEIETSDMGLYSPYFSKFFGNQDWEEDLYHEKDNVNNVLFISSNDIDLVYNNIINYDKLNKSDQEKEEEEKEGNKPKLKKHDLDFPGFIWKGQIPKDMIFGKAIIMALDFIENPEHTNLTLDEVRQLVQFKNFNGTEILCKKNNNFNLYSF